MNIFERKLLTVPKEVRVGMAIILGIIIVLLTRYGANATRADVLFAEMIHSVSDTLVIIVLYISFFVNKNLLKVLGKLSGVLLITAGVLAFVKVYATFVYIIITENYLVERLDVFFIVSSSIIALIALQMTLVWNEHHILHGENLSNEHLQTVHIATKIELLADITQACMCLLEYFIILALPDAPLLVRFVDFVLTLGLGWWMIKRGFIILVGRVHHNNHQKHNNDNH